MTVTRHVPFGQDDNTVAGATAATALSFRRLPIANVVRYHFTVVWPSRGDGALT